MNIQDTKNFLSRILSAFLFIPLIIMPILLKGYILYLFYIILLSFMTVELLEMIRIAKKKSKIIMYLIVCVITIFLFIISISSIDDINFKMIEIIMIIWIFDTFCYLGGKLFNGKKLMPNISKGKTFNGLYSGVFVTLFISSLYYIGLHNNIYVVFILVIPTIILSFWGDFIVSVLKRSVNIKDTGHIMPGHGGIIDRMDSFILVFFFFQIYLLIFK